MQFKIGTLGLIPHMPEISWLMPKAFFEKIKKLSIDGQPHSLKIILHFGFSSLWSE